MDSLLAEHDIFGGAVSDSDEEEPHIMEMEESSRMSADDSHISDSISLQVISYKYLPTSHPLKYIYVDFISLLIAVATCSRGVH